MALGNVLIIGFLLLGISIFVGEAKDLDATCTDGSTDECTVENSECPAGTCVCKTGFIKENGECPKALGQACDEADKCVTNSKCDGAAGSSTTCTCNDGFFNKDGLCSKAIGSDCGESTQCPANSNTECKTDKCGCKKDYEEKNDACILTVSGKDCSDTSKCDIDNAVCDTETSKCKCDADFTMNVDKCDPKNSAAMAEFGAFVLSLSVLTARFMML